MTVNACRDLYVAVRSSQAVLVGDEVPVGVRTHGHATSFAAWGALLPGYTLTSGPVSLPPKISGFTWTASSQDSSAGGGQKACHDGL
ncbi:MAG: hypothetical protein JOZ19_03525 [Rubrobacter sp.]|nr:hypothetical protein [Rubrobacter sp.]